MSQKKWLIVCSPPLSPPRDPYSLRNDQIPQPFPRLLNNIRSAQCHQCGPHDTCGLKQFQCFNGNIRGAGIRAAAKSGGYRYDVSILCRCSSIHAYLRRSKEYLLLAKQALLNALSLIRKLLATMISLKMSRDFFDEAKCVLFHGSFSRFSLLVDWLHEC